MMRIRHAELRSDLGEIVEIQRRALPRNFAVRMGREFLKSYYRALFSYPERILLVAATAEGLLGFVSGFGRPEQFYAHYRARRFSVLPGMLWGLMQNPGLLPTVLHNLKRISSVTASEGDVELSTICVLPEHCGGGLGKLLLGAFVKESFASGYLRVTLTTDARNNDYVNAFYERQGFALERHFFHGRREMNLYCLSKHAKETPDCGGSGDSRLTVPPDSGRRRSLPPSAIGLAERP